MYVWITTGELINDNASYFVSNLNVASSKFSCLQQLCFHHFGACSISLSMIFKLEFKCLKRIMYVILNTCIHV